MFVLRESVAALERLGEGVGEVAAADAVVGARQPDRGVGEGRVQTIRCEIRPGRSLPLRPALERLTGGELTERGVRRCLRGGRRNRVVEFAIQHQGKRSHDALLQLRDCSSGIGHGRALRTDAPPHLSGRHVHEVSASLDAVAHAKERTGDEVCHPQLARPGERLGAGERLQAPLHRRNARLGEATRDLILRQHRELTERGIARAVLERGDGDAHRSHIRGVVAALRARHRGRATARKQHSGDGG